MTRRYSGFRVGDLGVTSPIITRDPDCRVAMAGGGGGRVTLLDSPEFPVECVCCAGKKFSA